MTSLVLRHHGHVPALFQLTATISNNDAIKFADLDDTLWANIEQASSEGKLVLCMGAGSIDGWVRQKLNP